jgi:hypothetical protein
VHVLEHEHERLGLAEYVQQLEQRLEQTKLPGWFVIHGRRATIAERRQERGELCSTAGAERVERWMPLPHERSQSAQQRGVGKLALTLLDALSAEHERA